MLKRVCSRSLLSYGVQSCYKQSSAKLSIFPILNPKSVSRCHLFLGPSTVRHFYLTALSSKGKKSGKTKINMILHSVDNEFIRKATKEMDGLGEMLEEELSKHFTLRFDMRQYEELPVEIGDGVVEPLSKLGRVSLLNPRMISVNFTENPSVIKQAKRALETSSLEVSPQQEGFSLFIPIPKMTRERREQLADSAKKTLFNDYKLALNNVYSKIGKAVEMNIKIADEKRRTQIALLALKRERESKGLEQVEAAKMVLLKEIA